MKSSVPIYSFLVTFFLLTSCNSMVTKDSALYVLGKVTDEYGIALSDVAVNVGLLQTVTDGRGCFLFDGEYPEHPISITMSKVGYTNIKEEKPYSGYFIRAMITKINSTQTSQIVWTELDLSDPNIYVSCEGENLERFRIKS